MALYDMVTGGPTMVECRTARGDQALCGREGRLYEPVDVAPGAGQFWIKEGVNVSVTEPHKWTLEPGGIMKHVANNTMLPSVDERREGRITVPNAREDLG